MPFTDVRLTIGRGQRRGRRVLPPCHFGEPVDDMGTLRVQIECPVQRSRRFRKLPRR
jgi:hypothetical protein